MRARIADVWSRLCLGTGRLLYGIEDALDAATGWGVVCRIAAGVAGVLFVDGLLARSPALVYALPAVWLFAAWRMSDSSATPPPLPSAPLGDEFAGETEEVDWVEWSPEGVRCTIHPVRREVNDA